MNANMIINIVIRQVMRRVVNTGVNAGINAVGSKMNGRKQGQNDGTDMPRQQNQGGPDTRETTKRAKQAIRAGRRINKF